MVQSPPSYDLFVGVDISAKTAAVSLLSPNAKPDKAFSITQTLEGYQQLAQKLLAGSLPAQSILVVMEATGNYWKALALYLQIQGFSLSIINPAQAHSFAKTTRRHSKTDALDAQMLAELGQMLRPDPWQAPPEIYEEFNQRLRQRDDLQKMRQSLSNQLHALHAHPRPVKAVVERHEKLLAELTAQLRALEKELAQLAEDESHEWAKTIALLRTIPGVGFVTATTVVSLTMCFSRCPSVEALCSYAGVAPHEHQSGTSVNGRSSLGHNSNKELRRALYCCAGAALRYNDKLKAFYDRLRANGKAHKVALCAVARKLLRLCWWIARNGQPYDLDYQAR